MAFVQLGASLNDSSMFWNSKCEGGYSGLNFLEKVDLYLDKTFSHGDPVVREWFLVRQTLLPIALCGLYALFVTVLGPAFMRRREPMELRVPMILFNFSLVSVYFYVVFMITTNLQYVTYKQFCEGTPLIEGELPYRLVSLCWVLYILKYVEFIDTAFFILRKKSRSVTYLHVIHHTIVPIVGWILFRTETNGFLSIPVLLNSTVHIIMYSYYGLAAIGPHMRKYLWWKKYLTILQMVQFVMFLVLVLVVAPIAGCKLVKTSIWMDVVISSGLFLLFFNYYRQNFLKKRSD